MVRRTKDGLVRFSSYNDVQRALTSYAPAAMQPLIAKALAKPDRVAALLTAQSFIDEVTFVNAQALGACYASSVQDTLPTDVAISELRDTFINRTRSFGAQRDACLMELSHIAEQQARKLKLNLPVGYRKALPQIDMSGAKPIGQWRYLACNIGKKPYALFHVTSVTASIIEGDDFSFVNKLIGISAASFNMDRASSKADKQHWLFIVDKAEHAMTQLDTVLTVSGGKFRQCFYDAGLGVGVK